MALPLLALVQQGAAVLGGDGWHLFLTPGTIAAAASLLGRALWVMHKSAEGDRAAWLQQLARLDQALRGYDGEGGMLYDLRVIREARHTEAAVIASLQTQLAEVRSEVANLARRVEHLYPRNP